MAVGATLESCGGHALTLSFNKIQLKKLKYTVLLFDLNSVLQVGQDLWSDSALSATVWLPLQTVFKSTILSSSLRRQYGPAH
jgi:hypothetical protein